MRINIRLCLLSVAFAACSAGQIKPPSLPASEGTVAIVTPAALTVAFPPDPRADTGWHRLTVANRFAGYFWHVRISNGAGWLAAGLEVMPSESLEIPDFPSLARVVAAGHIRSCDLDSHVISCAGPIEAAARADGHRVVISITDTSWLRPLRSHRPAYVHLARGQENTYAWVDSVPLAYR